MKKILITGSSGMLGNILMEEFINKNQNVIGIDVNRPDNSNPFLKLDLTQSTNTKLFLKKIKPDVIIHTAAYTDVDFCEKNHEITNRLHIEATKLLSNYSNTRSKLIFISSDSVFKGDRGNYKEDDTKNPINFYAKTKDLAEELIKATCADYVIVRTNIFGFHQSNGNSLVEWALNMLSNGKQIHGFIDVQFNAIYTRFLSLIIRDIVELDLKGTYHVCSKDSLSKFEFLIKLAHIFKFNVDLITPLKITDLTLQASRPKNTTLNVDKIQSLLSLPTIEEGLLELYDDFKNKNKMTL